MLFSTNARPMAANLVENTLLFAVWFALKIIHYGLPIIDRLMHFGLSVDIGFCRELSPSFRGKILGPKAPAINPCNFG